MISNTPYLLSSIGKAAVNGTQGISSLFVGRDFEAALMERTIPRIGFSVFESEPDFCSESIEETPQLRSILERIRDGLRLAEPSLVAECLLCLRGLLLRTGPTPISAFRATTLSEMFRIASNPKEDLNTTMATPKLLDLITLLGPPDFGLETCFFFGEREELEVKVEYKVKTFTPLASKLGRFVDDGGKKR